MIYLVDIKDLVAKAPNKKLFTGRSNGEKAFQYFKLYNFSNDERVVLKIPTNIVISSSYFLGLLENIMFKYQDLNEFKKHIDDSELSDANLREFNRAVKRGFFENTGLL
jgi:hypothetical protein